MEEDDYLIDQQFGEWLKSRRIRKSLSLKEVAAKSNLSIERLQDLEEGIAEIGITTREIDVLGDIYNLDPRAIHSKAIYGDMS